nr:hypothetical protein [Tanacetum cinerariifolium]
MPCAFYSQQSYKAVKSFPIADTPTANSPGYILELDPKGDLAEDDEEDPEEDHADSTVVALLVIDHVPSEVVTKPLPHKPSPPLPIPSPPPNSPTHIEIPESSLPLQKRLHFASPTPSQEAGESSAAGAARQDKPALARDDPYSLVREELYGFFDRGTTIMYGMMEDAQDDWSQLRSRVNLLYRDRPVHHCLAVMIEREARMAREAWGLSMDASNNAHSDAISLHTTLVAQHALILDLQAADRRRQRVIKELLAADHKRHVRLTKALRGTITLSWKPCNGGSSQIDPTCSQVQYLYCKTVLTELEVNVTECMMNVKAKIHHLLLTVLFSRSVDGVTTSFQLSQISRHHMLDHQDKYMMKAQVHVLKSSAIYDIQALPRRKYYYQVVNHMLRGEIVSKAFKILSIRVVAQDRKAA